MNEGEEVSIRNTFEKGVGDLGWHHLSWEYKNLSVEHAANQEHIYIEREGERTKHVERFHSVQIKSHQ